MNFRSSSLRVGAMAASLSILFFIPYSPSYAEDVSSTSRIEPAGILSIADAGAAALVQSPLLDAYSYDVRAAEARKLQAGYRPNPEFGVDAEELRWHPTDDGGPSGLSGTELTVGISQLFELGGKRLKRVEASSLDIELASWDYESVRADVLASVAQRFVEVLVAQQRTILAQDTVTMAENVKETIAARVEAGQVSPLELRRADIAASTAKIAHARSVRELDSARAQLASTWGSTTPIFERARGALDSVRPIPSLRDVRLRTSTNPDIARWMTEIAFRESIVRVERSNRIPDLTLSAGYRVTELGAARDKSAVAGFSLPLPLFNRNKGSILEAKHMVTRANRMSEATKVDVYAQLAAAYFEVSAAYLEVESLDRDVVPRATETFESIREAYRQGKFGYLDVLDAQRTLFEIRVQRLEALGSYHRGISVIDRLIGESLFKEYDFTAAEPEEN